MTGETTREGSSTRPVLYEVDDNEHARGSGSFCVPRKAIDALLEHGATAYEICAYLTLARYTDAEGRLSSASISAINRATGANKTQGGPVARAIERLKGIRVRDQTSATMSDRKSTRTKTAAPRDLGPILYDSESWHRETGELFPPGPVARASVRHILPTFNEPLAERVWFGNNLVSGVGDFRQPLKTLKNAGDAAARLLLALYAANDMETWGGVPPGRQLPWVRFEPSKADVSLGHTVRIIFARNSGLVGCADPRICTDTSGLFTALSALESCGLAYRVTMVANRNGEQRHFSTGAEYTAVPDDAEPLYELDTHSLHGYKPVGEEGIGGATAKTAGELGHSVADHKGQFSGTYAAFVSQGFPAMIVGLFRLRLRVSNPRNAGVTGSWARIYQNNRDAFARLSAIRKQHNLAPLDAPWATT